MIYTNLNIAYFVKVFYDEEDLFPFLEVDVPAKGYAYINLNAEEGELFFQVYNKKILDNNEVYLDYVGELVR